MLMVFLATSLLLRGVEETRHHGMQRPDHTPEITFARTPGTVSVWQTGMAPQAQRNIYHFEESQG